MTDGPVDYENGVCQRTGFKVKASDLVREDYTGLMVRRASVDPRHPLLDMPAPRGDELRDDATGPDTDNDLGDTDAPPTLAELVANR